MRFPVVRLFTFCALVLLAGCAAAPPPAPDTRAADEAAIRSADERWSSAATRRDLDATVGFYTADAVVLAPNAPIATDAKSIRDSWAGLLTPDMTVSWKATKVEVAKSGDIGYLYGAYDIAIKNPKGGPPTTDKGKILEVWKKQADGSWKCSVDTYNSDLPLPAAK